MLTTLKSEFRKLLTVRSTYFMTGFTLLAITFFAIYVFGYQQAAQNASNPSYMVDTLYSLLGTAVIFVTIIAILLVAHEYRYNTINYTLTLNRSRLKVLLSKAIVMLAYATALGVAVVAIGYFGSKLGLQLKGVPLAPQTLSWIDVLWQFTAYVWGYALVGIILAALIRGVVGSIVAFFLIPTAESILSMILKGNTKFLPFRSLDTIAAPQTAQLQGIEHLSQTAALGVFTVYLVVFGVITAVLFVKRDAS